jgi:predicted nucleotidyltransferase
MTAREEPAVVPGGVRETLRTDPDVQFVVSFGSRVGGSATPSSDLDIAITFEDALSDDERFRKLCHLSGHIQDEDAPTIDVSDIEDLPIEVAHRRQRGVRVW